MSQSENAQENEDVQAPTVRDRRRIDPLTGQKRDSKGASGPASPDTSPDDEAAAVDEMEQARAQAAERLDDLKRLQAEYVNYRRRVERDRDVARDTAKAEVLGEFLAVLDDIGRAREHGDLTGAFRSVGEAVESITTKAGLERFGEAGDAFDPNIHEALSHAYDDTVTAVTCGEVLQPGYRIGDRVLRPARVAVVEPTETLPVDEEPADN